MLPDRVSNPGPLIYESGALPTVLRGPADWIYGQRLYHSFFYLDSLNKRPFSKQTCLKLQRRQRLERLNVSSEATYSLCYCTPFSLNEGGGHFPQQSGDIICT